MSLQNKIDFAVIFKVENANPNGDPLNGNRPRADYLGIGEVTDVAIKRKIRDRLLESGHNIFVQSDDRKTDNATSLKDRADKTLDKKLSKDEAIKLACKTWLDVRTFGQLFAYAGDSKKKGDGVSIPIRGPVSIHSAFSIEPVSITSTQITKSVNSEGDGSSKGSDTMGMKHRVDHGIYVFKGSMNPQLAEKTGFSDEDAQVIKGVLPKLFENDASSARPEGSMEVLNVFWWQHNSKGGQYSSAKVHHSLTNVTNEGGYELRELEGLTPEILAGF